MTRFPTQLLLLYQLDTSMSKLKAPAATTGARCDAAHVLQIQYSRGGTTTSKAGFHVSLARLHSSISTLMLDAERADATHRE